MRARPDRQDAVDRSAIWRVPSLGGIEIFEAHFTRFTYARHSHESYALGVIDGGAMLFWHRGTVCTVPTGSLIAINPGEVHDGRPATKDGCRYRMLYVERAAIDRWLAADAPRIGRVLALRGPTLEDPPLARAVRRFHRVLVQSDADPHRALEMQSRLIQVLYLFFAGHGEQAIESVGIAPEKRCIERAKEYLAAHVADPTRLTALAEYVGLSPFYFLRTFKRVTGLPPHSYLNQLRLERARVLLRRGEPPAEVAAALGLVDQSHLSRRFKAAFGVTPGQYAKAARHYPAA